MQNNQQYKSWLGLARASAGALQLIEKLALFGSQDDDDEFEDEDEMDVNENEEQVPSEDLSTFGWNILAVSNQGALLNMTIEFSSSLPAYRGLPTSATQVLDELCEYSFRTLTEILYSYPATLQN